MKSRKAVLFGLGPYAAGFCLMLGNAPLAQAGFEWVPPPAVQEKPASAARISNREADSSDESTLAPLPVQKVESESLGQEDSILVPLKITNAPPIPTPSAPAMKTIPEMGAQKKSQPAGQKPEHIEWRNDRAVLVQPGVNAPVEKTASPRQAAAGTSTTFTPVEGFGSDIPLALALSNVVPSHYSFAFGKDVNPGYRVSWTGGKPWNEIVADMVAPLNLTSSIQGQTVHISAAGGNGFESADLTPQAPSVRRKSISDPGENPETQPAQTMNRVRMLSETRAQAEPLKSDSAPVPLVLDIKAYPRPESGLYYNTDTETPVKTGMKETQAQANFWEAEKGSDLHTLLQDWSETADVTLVWKAREDYRISKTIMVNDSFSKALKTVFSEGIENTAPSMTFINDEQGRKLVITDRG
ncbi:MAG: toxin co-regulated pilus biosynthesis Q family protein [Alphaproteobacteria bacterium]|nr:toxin co-regulated pilus biosynthesis Q family protein [Alphaproteobacteria bacterium]